MSHKKKKGGSVHGRVINARQPDSHQEACLLPAEERKREQLPSPSCQNSAHSPGSCPEDVNLVSTVVQKCGLVVRPEPQATDCPHSTLRLRKQTLQGALKVVSIAFRGESNGEGRSASLGFLYGFELLNIGIFLSAKCCEKCALYVCTTCMCVSHPH